LGAGNATSGKLEHVKPGSPGGDRSGVKEKSWQGLPESNDLSMGREEAGAHCGCGKGKREPSTGGSLGDDLFIGRKL